MRLDKYLKVSRIIKRRAVAKEAGPAKKSLGQTIVNIGWDDAANQGTLNAAGVNYLMPGELIPKLKADLEKNPANRVLVRADKSVRWSWEREVLRAIGEAGISNVTFSVVDKPMEKK